MSHRQQLFDLPPPRPMVDLEARPARASRAPLSRRALDTSRPWFLLFLGALGLAVSWGTTILLCLRAQLVLQGVQDWRGALVGVVVAGFLTAGQLFFSDTSLLLYVLFLAPDVAISYSQLEEPVSLLVAALFGLAAPVQWLTMGVILVLCVVSSYLPERTLFGERRKK